MEHPEYLCNLQETLSNYLADIARLFKGTPKITLVVRNGEDSDHTKDIVIGNDDEEKAISAIRSLYTSPGVVLTSTREYPGC